MTPTQRDAATRLALLLEQTFGQRWVFVHEAVALLRELAQEPAQEPVAWGQLGTLNGKTYLRMNYDRTPYPPPADVARNLNLVPLFAGPQQRQLTLAELTTVCEQIVDAGHMNTEDLARLRAALENL